MKTSTKINRLIVLVFSVAMVFCQSSVGFAASSSPVKATAIINTVLNEDTGNVTIKWTKVSGADGYQIYRAEMGSAFKRIASVKGTKTSYTDRSVQTGNTVKYKIRAFKKVNGKTKYSKFSSVKSTIVWTEAETLSFDALLEDFSTVHEKQQTDKVSFNGFTDYLVSGSEYQNLLSQKEIDSLRNPNGFRPSSISYEKAVSDVELFFRTLKYAYGAYFYFGGEDRFDRAEKEVLNSLKGKRTVTRGELERLLKKSLSFVRDGHFGVGNSAIENKSVRYEYFYSGIYFSKDEKGYYKEVDGTRWYYQSCTDKKARIEPSLTSEGEIKYSLVLFCPVTETDLKDSITLKNDKKNMSMSVRWVQQSALKSSSSRTQDYVFQEEGGISYISIRCFDNELDQTIYKKFENSAKDVKDSRLIIYDIRSNGGGSDQYGREWVKIFTGEDPVLNSAFSNRETALSENIYASLGKEKYNYRIKSGKFIENDIPVIILVDDLCGSAGESALLFAKSMDNVIVIGSNSAGYQLCGNVATYKLPNTGIYFNMPVSLQFKYNMTNVDGIGYEPDVWCNPKDALGAAYNLIIKTGYADKSSINQLKSKIKASTPDEITLKWGSFIIPACEGFGCPGFNNDLTVMCNGEKISDYKAYFEDSSFGSIEKNKDGTMHIKAKKEGSCHLYIEYKGQKWYFRLATA